MYAHIEGIRMKQEIIRKKISILIISTAILLTGCFDSSDNKTLAKINGETLTQQDLDAYLAVKRIPADQKKLVDDAFNKLLDREIQSSRIEEAGSFDKNTIDMEVAEFKRQLLISRYFERFIKENVSDDAVRNYYASNSDKYTAHQVKVAHVLIRTNRKMSENENKAALSTINEAYSKVMTGQPFADIATKYSDDKLSAKKNGELGWVKRGGIDPRFSDIAFKLKSGEVSKPFKTAYGYHIVKVLEEPKAVSQPFDSVKGNIRYQLRNEAKAAEIERLRKESDVTIYYGKES